jgi:hypothetical protein
MPKFRLAILFTADDSDDARDVARNTLLPAVMGLAASALEIEAGGLDLMRARWYAEDSVAEGKDLA